MISEINLDRAKNLNEQMSSHTNYGNRKLTSEHKLDKKPNYLQLRQLKLWIANTPYLVINSSYTMYSLFVMYSTLPQYIQIELVSFALKVNNSLRRNRSLMVYLCQPSVVKNCKRYFLADINYTLTMIKVTGWI